MENNEDRGISGWGSRLLAQSTEEVARAIAAATSDLTVNNISPVSPRPSVIFSSKDEDPGSPLKKLHFQIGRILKGLSPLSEVKRSAYNPEILTSQKRQWARFQMQSMDHRSVPEPSKLIESMVVVGLHPKINVQEIQSQIVEKSYEDAKKSRGILCHHNQVHADLNLEPEVLFVYPPDKKLPLNYKDLISFCFPAGIEIRAVERTPSLSELNQMLLGQEQVNQNDVSFVFRLQVADNSTLYGCCYLIEELVQKPSNLVSSVLGKQSFSPTLSRHVLTTPRCYCILSRLPFFELHFGILKSIFTEERFEGLETGIEMLNLLALKEDVDDINKHMESLEFVNENAQGTSYNNTMLEKSFEPEQETIQEGFSAENKRTNSLAFDVSSEAEKEEAERERVSTLQNGHTDFERHLPCPALISFQGSLYEDGNFSRSCMDDSDIEEPSVSGQDDSNRQNDIFNWAKANKHGSLQIICKYYRLQCPARGSTITFQPLEHLNPLEFHRPSESILTITGSNIDVRSCNNSLEIAEAYGACMAEEEAAALSAWTVACICGHLRLEHVMLMFAGALLEKNIVIVCSNLGILSASVLSIISLIRPYQWQSLLMPVLPNDMLDFLEAPVPYIIGIKNKTADVLSKLVNVILVDVNKNQVKSPSMPQLPQYKELFSSLSPYHAKLVGESYLARKRPIYECTDVQIEAAKGFLGVLRTYLDSLCSNLRSHTITNVQSNEDKVSLLLKESFIDSFPSRDRPFMKQFVDTQLFSVHTDMVLSYYQKD